MTLSRGQDIPHRDDMNSFKGEEFTMTCPQGLSPFKWCVKIICNEMTVPPDLLFIIMMLL